MIRVLFICFFALFCELAFAISRPQLSVSPSTVNDGSSTTLSWNQPHGTAYFHLWVRKPGHGWYRFEQQYSSISYQRGISGLGVHNFYVEACDGKGACASSGVVSVNSIDPNAAPGTPSFSGPSYHIVRGTYSYSWSAVSGNVTHYQVEKTFNGSVQYPYTNVGTSTSYTESFDSLIVYQARVRACNNTVCGNWSNYYANEIQPYWKPNGVLISGPSDVALNESFSINWNQPWGEAINRYEVQKSVGNTSSWQLVQSSMNRSYTDSLTSGATHYYRVNVCNIDDKCSGYSAAKSVSLKVEIPATPAMPYVTADLYYPVNSKVRVSIPSSANTDSFYIYSGTSETDRAVALEVSASQSYVDIDTVSAGPNYIRLAACNSAGCSAESQARRIHVYNSPTDALPSVSNAAPSIGELFKLSWNTPIGTIWYGAYYKISCITPSNKDVCDKKITHSGGQKSYELDLTLDEIGVHTIQILSCNETDMYCSKNGLISVRVKPGVEELTVEFDTPAINRVLTSQNFISGVKVLTGQAETAKFRLNNGQWFAASQQNLAPQVFTYNFGNLQAGLHQIEYQVVDINGRIESGAKTIAVTPTSTNTHSIKDYGATSLNDNDDDAIAFQKAIDVASFLNHSVYIPPETYLLKSSLTITKPITIKGNSVRASQVKSNLSEVSRSLFNIEFTDYSARKFRLEELSILSINGSKNTALLKGKGILLFNQLLAAEGDLSAYKVGNGVSITNNAGVEVELESIQVIGFTKNIIIGHGGLGNGYIRDAHIHGGFIGIEAVASSHAQKEINVERVIIETIEKGVYVEGHTIKLVNSTIQGKGIYPDVALQINQSFEKNKIFNIYMEGIVNFFRLNDMSHFEIDSIFTQVEDGKTASLITAINVNKIILNGITAQGSYLDKHIDLTNSHITGDIAAFMGNFQEYVIIDEESSVTTRSYSYTDDTVKTVSAGEEIIALDNLLAIDGLYTLKVEVDGEENSFIIYSKVSKFIDAREINNPSNIDLVKGSWGVNLNASKQSTVSSITLSKVN